MDPAALSKIFVEEDKDDQVVHDSWKKAPV